MCNLCPVQSIVCSFQCAHPWSNNLSNHLLCQIQSFSGAYQNTSQYGSNSPICVDITCPQASSCETTDLALDSGSCWGQSNEIYFLQANIFFSNLDVCFKSLWLTRFLSNPFREICGRFDYKLSWLDYINLEEKLWILVAENVSMKFQTDVESDQ